jgi:hypothetical protein
VIVVRYAALAALALWLGGTSVLGLLAAPASTGAWSAPAWLVGLSSETALDGYLSLFHVLSYTCGAILIVSLLVIKFVGPPPAAFKARLALVSLMLVCAAYSRFPLAREIKQLNSTAAGIVDEPAAFDADRQRLDWLHRIDLMLMGLNIVLGASLLTWYVRD